MKTKPCLITEKCKDRKGYGYIKIRGKTTKTHRYAYAQKIGVDVFDIPRTTYIRHTCDNPSCIEPSHLLAGSAQDNMDDMVQRGRSIKGSKVNTAKITEEEAIEILSIYTGAIGEQTELGNRYGVRSAVIGRLVNGHTWRHLHNVKS